MQVKMQWQVRVEATETIDALDEFSSETLRGLVNSEMVPENAWVESASYDWNRKAQVVIRWDTVNKQTADLHEPKAS